VGVGRTDFVSNSRSDLKVSTVDCGDSEQNNSLSTDSEELRQGSLEMANYWMDAAMRTECLGDSHIELEQQAA